METLSGYFNYRLIVLLELMVVFDHLGTILVGRDRGYPGVRWEVADSIYSQSIGNRPDKCSMGNKEDPVTVVSLINQSLKAPAPAGNNLVVAFRLAGWVHVVHHVPARLQALVTDDVIVVLVAVLNGDGPPVSFRIEPFEVAEEHLTESLVRVGNVRNVLEVLNDPVTSLNRPLQVRRNNNVVVGIRQGLSGCGGLL